MHVFTVGFLHFRLAVLLLLFDLVFAWSPRHSSSSSSSSSFSFYHFSFLHWGRVGSKQKIDCAFCWHYDLPFFRSHHRDRATNLTNCAINGFAFFFPSPVRELDNVSVERQNPALLSAKRNNTDRRQRDI
jgi:hypothetical protein